jgi:hypothetical protein
VHVVLLKKEVEKKEIRGIGEIGEIGEIRK